MTDKWIPGRLCAGCRQQKPKTELMRVVRLPDGEIEFDPGGKKDGRGVYICRNRECLNTVMKKRGLERSLGTGISKEKKELLLKEMTIFVEK